MTTHPDHVEPNRRADASCSVADSFLLETVRLERQAALDVVAGDISHEIVHTLNFLRCLVGGAADAPGLSSEDASLAQNEIERLQRMLGHLRRLKLSPPERQSVQLLAVLRRAEAEITDLIVEKRVAASFVIAERVALLADPRLLYILVRDALAAVVSRAEPSSTVEVWAALPEGLNPGMVKVQSNTSRKIPPTERDLFDPWAATPDRPANLGLSIAYRIARALGWNLSAVSDASREGLCITIPSAAFSSEPDR